MGEGFKKINKEKDANRKELIAAVILWWLDRGFKGPDIETMFQYTRNFQKTLELYIEKYKNINKDSQKRIKVFVARFRRHLDQKSLEQSVVEENVVLEFKTTTKNEPTIEAIAKGDDVGIHHMTFSPHTTVVIDFKEIKATYQCANDPEPILIFPR